MTLNEATEVANQELPAIPVGLVDLPDDIIELPFDENEWASPPELTISVNRLTRSSDGRYHCALCSSQSIKLYT